MQIWTKRAYDKVTKQDGTRVLVDAMWPRGVKKQDLDIDWWARDLAPSDDLRRWFGHDPDKWEDFKKSYFRELGQGPDGLAQLLAMAEHGRVTLVYAAADTTHNNAVALKEYLEQEAP